ncbi:Shikimate kinase 2 [Cedecea neteri]|uniref:shikimate kinase n=1 Tax=Cedecea neteri TaxID=158822 RepID=A0A2X2T3Z2_9ENTR|nr:Shikimate kinase 2 [Cedecea neteri]
MVKTTVGHALARKLGYAFVDTDSFLLNHTGNSVAEIVAEEGWEGFRARESDALQRVTAPATVVATGGGMVLAEGNRQFMQENGIPVWLHAPAQVLASRLTASPEEGQRPTLTGKGVTDEIVGRPRRSRRALSAGRPAHCGRHPHTGCGGGSYPQRITNGSRQLAYT